MNKVIYEVRYRAGAVLFEEWNDAENFRRSVMLSASTKLYNPPASDPDHTYIVPRVLVIGVPNPELAVAS